MALVVMLERTTLQNVDDAAGRWQFEGGSVVEDTRQVGHYASTKRVIFGATDAQNTAMLTIEVFFTPQLPPQNIVLQGLTISTRAGKSVALAPPRPSSQRISANNSRASAIP